MRARIADERVARAAARGMPLGALEMWYDHLTAPANDQGSPVTGLTC